MLAAVICFSGGLKPEAIIGAPIHQPISRFRVLEPLVRYRCVRPSTARAGPCVTRSAISRLHLNLMYDIVGFLSKVVRSYENLCSRCVV